MLMVSLSKPSKVVDTQVPSATPELRAAGLVKLNFAQHSFVSLRMGLCAEEQPHLTLKPEQLFFGEIFLHK